MKRNLLAIVLCICAWATASAQSGSYNPGSADAIRTVSSVAGLPCRATAPVQFVYKTGLSAGIYWCSALNTWSGPISTGTVTGTGAANRLALWSGTSALSSDTGLTFDGTNDDLTIGRDVIAGRNFSGVGAVLSGLTASRAVVTDGSKNLSSSAVTGTELGYVSGVTSAIQTQFTGKVATTRAVNTTAPITGGGDLSADRTIACATCGVTGTGLEQFASTTSAQLAGVLSDETGSSGGFVRAGGPTFTGTVTVARIIQSVVALTDASTIAVDASLGNKFRVTLGGNRTLGNPTNATDGQTLTFEIIQDGTGSRTLAYDTKFAFGTDITGATLTTTLNKRDFLTVQYNSTADKFYVVGFVKGY